MNMFCTGNPSRKTIAYALKPDQCASFSLGWDFTKEVFVNSAYVASGVQESLMNVCHAKWMQSNMKGHIVNIGTTLENTNDTSDYTRSKQELKRQSLILSEETGISGIKTSYIVLGGVGTDMCELDHIQQTINWIIDQPFRIPIIQLESVK
jgi:NAD(P)-dependent dehydrogenase (short-subunit alcohol dehydrogenase family)